jgi:glycerol-1-phosphate dehydrogenase [NAD(P)+]
MMSLMQGKEHALHGTQVGVAAVAVLRAYELLASCDIDFSCVKYNAAMYCSQCWEKQMRAIYGRAADAVIALEATAKKNYPSNVLSRIDTIEKQWKDIKGIIKGLPTADSIKSILSRLPAPYSPAGINVDKNAFVNGFIAAKELRNRYGLLQFLFDLGLTEDIASKVWEYFIQED